MEKKSAMPSREEAGEARIPCLVSAEIIDTRVRELARQISVDYAGKQPVVVGILKGAWVFMADLVRHLTIPVRCDFVRLSSYGDCASSSGEVKLRLDVSLPLEGQDVLLVEDIVDTGITIPWLLEHLRKQQPASVRLCVLLDKPARRGTAVSIDYVGFTIPDHFVVGYGIDYAERYRELPYIGFLPSNPEAP